jgi:predicted outer membrane repeat protein
MAKFKEEKMKNWKFLVRIPLIMTVFAVVITAMLTNCEPQIKENTFIGFWYVTPIEAHKGDTANAAFQIKENGSLLVNNGKERSKDWRRYSYEIKNDSLSLKDQKTQEPKKETKIKINEVGTELTIEETCFLLKGGNKYYKEGGGSYQPPTTPETEVKTPTVTPIDVDPISTTQTVRVTLDIDTFGASIFYYISGGDDDDGEDDEDGGATNKPTRYILGDIIPIKSSTAATITLNVFATKTGMTDSEEYPVDYIFEVKDPTVETPIATSKDINYTTSETANVTLRTETPEADIYYTINGKDEDKDPVTDGIYYTPGTSIAIRSSTIGTVTLKAIAVKDGVSSGLLETQYVFSTPTKAITVINAADKGVNTLRDALAKVANGGTITIDNKVVKEIKLASSLIINRNVTIEGNGVTITKGTTYPDSGNSLIVNGMDSVSGGKTLIIRRVHFKEGVDLGESPEEGEEPADNGKGGAIYNNKGGSLTLESCIFSSNSAVKGGAIYNDENSSAIIRGCTFANNTADDSGGVIYHKGKALSLLGNIFYNNSAASEPIVFGDPDKITSLGYNVVSDVNYGIASNESGWEKHTEDRTLFELVVDDDIDSPFVDDETFEPIEQLNIVPKTAKDFPTVDFNGVTRTKWPVAPGAMVIKDKR